MAFNVQTNSTRHKAFQNSLLETLRHEGSKGSDDNAPKLGKLAFKKACGYLEESIVSERAAASFVCGGTVSRAVRVFWDTPDDAEAHKLVLPLRSNRTGPGASRPERLKQLIADCEPASFGRGQQEVIDPQYRKAGKLDPSRFTSDFCPDELGIVRLAEQYLLPNFNTENQNSLPFRRLRAELYKLNVYSGPSGLFQKHVDTPRSEHQIGSLVVCLPSRFQGGNLIVRHDQKEVDFDWALHSASTIQWAAFYSDCEHEIKQVTQGDRVTLTYNLFVTEPEGGSIPPQSISDPTKLPLYEFMKGLLGEPGFMKDGGVLGVYCSHAYPHTANNAKGLLPRGLKGADLALYSVLRSLKIKVDVRPVLDYDFGSDGELVGNKLHPFVKCRNSGSEDETLKDVAKYRWPFEQLFGITWLAKPKHRTEAFSYATYGNEPSSDVAYSYAAILAIIPPFTKRPKAFRTPN